jgi:acyl CoA:acetate/3-ketoacid CoA transferase beta subunit
MLINSTQPLRRLRSQARHRRNDAHDQKKAEDRPTLQHCSLPLTSTRPISLIVTELAVIEPTAEGFLLKELAPGITVTAVRQATEAELIIPEHVPEMPISLVLRLW